MYVGRFCTVLYTSEGTENKNISLARGFVDLCLGNNYFCETSPGTYVHPLYVWVGTCNSALLLLIRRGTQMHIVDVTL